MPRIANTDRARELRRNSTFFELKLWQRLRNRQIYGCKFKRQVPRGRYIVDFLCDEAKLVVELDGAQHLFQKVYDAKRTSELEADGYRVIRIWNFDIVENLDGVVETIGQAIESRRGKGPSP